MTRRTIGQFSAWTGWRGSAYNSGIYAISLGWYLINSMFRWLAGVTALLGLALASAPSQAISVVGNLGWQPVPATCAVATNISYNLAQRKFKFQCGPTSVQFSCTPAAAVNFSVPNQRVTVACASNTITALTSTRSVTPDGQPQMCSMNDFDFNLQERTVSFTCTSSPSIRRTCYAETLPLQIDYVAATVNLGYCPEADMELIGHAGFEEGELWRPTFGQSP